MSRIYYIVSIINILRGFLIFYTDGRPLERFRPADKIGRDEPPDPVALCLNLASGMVWVRQSCRHRPSTVTHKWSALVVPLVRTGDTFDRWVCLHVKYSRLQPCSFGKIRRSKRQKPKTAARQKVINPIIVRKVLPTDWIHMFSPNRRSCNYHYPFRMRKKYIFGN